MCIANVLMNVCIANVVVWDVRGDKTQNRIDQKNVGGAAPSSGRPLSCHYLPTNLKLGSLF